MQLFLWKILKQKDLCGLIEPTEQAAPTSTPASSAPVSTFAPTSKPTPTTTPEPHTHSYNVVQAATCTVDGIKKCSCGDTIAIPANGHTYVNQTIPETGHYEQVQVGTQTVVVDTEKYWVYQCKGCRAYFDWHTNPDNPDSALNGGSISDNCMFSASNMIERKRDITEEQPVYKDKWIVDTAKSQIQICSVCGHQEP